MTTKINNGGPAFPVTDHHCENGQIQIGDNGMTLRDWFAGQTLTSILKSSGDLSCYYDHMVGSKGDHNIPSPTALALFAYEIADAMIAAKNRI